ncbi:MAG: lysophospholipid acyltransferase family protein [Acholeplasmataceae bacterium]
MKKRWMDYQQDFLMGLLRPFAYLWMRKDMKRIVHRDPNFSFRRNEPYVMIANHTFLFDVIHVPLRLKKVPFIIGSQTLFAQKASRFMVTKVAHVIKKSKSATDTQTVREIIHAVKRGYPILIFPEGDTTFYGQTNYIEPSTFKLIKKLGIDCVTCKVKGGYLSKPRWATSKRKNRHIELFYEVTIPKEQIKDLSVNEIEEIITKKLYHNDYDYQREAMIKHPGDKLAEGLENVCYVCPMCQSLHTIETKGNEISCRACQHKGFVDDYGFIQNFKFDNLVDWDAYQKTFEKELHQSTFQTSGALHEVIMAKKEQNLIGQIDMVYKDETFIIRGAKSLDIPLKEISEPTITLLRDFGFIFNDQHYILKLDRYSAAVIRVSQTKY